jgi:hypothetical protein
LKVLQTSGNGFMAVEMMDHPIGIYEISCSHKRGTGRVEIRRSA